jgi:hypothetical protein
MSPTLGLSESAVISLTERHVFLIMAERSHGGDYSENLLQSHCYLVNRGSVFSRNFLFAAVSLFSALLTLLSEAVAADKDDETTIEFHGPSLRPGYPDPFSIGYILRKNTLSPDKQYGVIFPKLFLADQPDFIVNISNSAILGSVELGELVTPYFEHQNFGRLTVSWSPDSSAALVEIGEKWSPGALVVIEIKDGKIERQTNLSDQVEKLFSPATAKHTRSHETGVGTYGVTASKWKVTEKSKQLQLKCEGQTNPKEFPNQSTWEGTLLAVWDLELHKFVEHEVTQTGFTPAGKADQ